MTYSFIIGLLHAVEKLFSSSMPLLDNEIVSTALNNIDNFAQAQALIQHHDGVSGTSKQVLTWFQL